MASLAGMLQAEHPKATVHVWDNGGVRMVDRSAGVQRLAAEAIVAIAASDDPLVIAARTVLARPEPK